MEKYDTYTLEESNTQRIDLHRNFRSRSEVLDLTNDVCYRIMARDLGNVAYDEDAALYAGADYCAPDEAGMFAPEILVADSAEELLEGSGYEDRKLYEAKLVAERIRKLMISQMVTDKATGELRAVRYSDIVILLRSLSGYADSYAAVLNEAGNTGAYGVSNRLFFGGGGTDGAGDASDSRQSETGYSAYGSA